MQSAALAIACQAIRSVKAKESHAVAVLLHSGAAKSTRACFDGGTGTGREQREHAQGTVNCVNVRAMTCAYWLEASQSCG